MATRKQEELKIHERVGRACALADLLHDYLRDGMDCADPDTIIQAVEILHETLSAIPSDLPIVQGYPELVREGVEASRGDIATRRAAGGAA